jgi:hypothetical protein
MTATEDASLQQLRVDVSDVARFRLGSRISLLKGRATGFVSKITTRQGQSLGSTFGTAAANDATVAGTLHIDDVRDDKGELQMPARGCCERRLWRWGGRVRVAGVTFVSAATLGPYIYPQLASTVW